MDGNSSRNSHVCKREVSCFNEALPILQYICCKLDEANVRNESAVIFLLECLHTFISCLPQKIYQNTHFTTFLWQKFCPVLIAFLGTPRVDKIFTSCEDKSNTKLGHGSGYLNSSLGFDSHQAKTIYSIGTEMVRLVGCVGPLRPVLESVFHRMLLYPPPQQRLEPLKALKELLRSPSRIVDFAGPLLVDDEKSSQLHSDMALMRLAMDSIEESTNVGLLNLQASVSCVVSMLSALQDLCKGKAISYKYTCAINNLYDDLESCDYRGPLTYQSMARLPKTYKEQLELIKNSHISDSDSSGHGPSEDGDLSDIDIPINHVESMAGCPEDAYCHHEDNGYALADELERLRLERLPKSVHVSRHIVEEYNIDTERHNARKFFKTLKQDLLPKVLSLRTNIEVDEVLQKFASDYCQEVFAVQQKLYYQKKLNLNTRAMITIINADGIYLATYAALLLNFRLIRTKYYIDDTQKIPVTEQEFVEEVHGVGVLVYLSATWLSELYQHILVCNLLEKCGYNPSSPENSALVNVLIDIDGITGCHAGGQLLSDYLRLERAQLSCKNLTPEAQAGAKFSRRVLTCCWDSMIAVLTAGLNPCKDELFKGILSKDDSKKGIKDTIVTSLEGLHKAAMLSNVLGLQSRCGKIFALLAKTACSEQLTSKLRRTKDVLRLKLQNKITNLHTSHALSMEILLTKGLELGSHGSDCWIHVFTCCLFVSKLEHDFFGNNQDFAFLKMRKKDKKKTSIECKSNKDKLKLSFNTVDDDYDICVDTYSFLSPPYTQCITSDTIPDIIQESNAETQFNGILPTDYAAKIVCLLSQQVDRLYEDAVLKLNLCALCSFLQALCRASKDQLFKSTNSLQESWKIWWPKSKRRDDELNILLLSRLGEVMSKCVKSGRPLIHIMRVWSILGPHFMEAACHKDRIISKKAVECIHNSMAVLLNDQLEQPHFHFNEALFKPFENLLCLELVDNDVQDQIVSCICEFVETNRTEIRSGWRPLFGALKVASVGSAVCVESAPLLEVFRVFLSTDNTLVFANAALDCILCLLRHVRGIGEPETPITEADTDHMNEQVNNVDGRKMRFCLESLKYLLNCSDILASMYHMPACPTFYAAQRIQISGLPQYVDPIIPNLEVARFDRKTDSLQNCGPEVSYELLTTVPDPQALSLQSMDKPSGILRVWYLLIEGLVSATMISPRRYQPHTLETLFHILRNILKIPAPLFGLYCINHLLLPMVQSWLRKMSKIYRGWDNFAPNFKQCCGLTTDLVVDFIAHLQGPDAKKNEDFLQPTTLMLKQLFLVMAECVAQPTESIARLGCACIRHVLVSSGPNLSPEQWEVCGVACHRACSISLQELHQLMMAFSERSESFNGDIAHVKVAARRDATLEETKRLRQLAAQVFLMEEQRLEELSEPPDEKSYIFLLYPPSVTSSLNRLNPELYIVRVQIRALVVSLLVHQMLLQCIANVLLQNCETSSPSFSSVLMSPIVSPKLCCLNDFLDSIDSHHMDTFISALDLSYTTALKFDSRPGLKLLMQKVAGLQRPANLYHQARTAWTAKVFSLIKLCLKEIVRSCADLETIQNILKNKLQPDPKYKVLLKYLLLLQTTFDELCGTYVDIALDRDGRYTKVDSMAGRKFLLLVSQPDELAEISTYSVETKNGRENHHVVYGVTPNSENDYQDEEESNTAKDLDDTFLKDLGVNLVDEKDEEMPPFRLSDLTAEYSSDSGPQSEPQTDEDDSRPVSRLGSSNSRIAYIDRSGGTTSEYLFGRSEDFVVDTPELQKEGNETLRSKSIMKNVSFFTTEKLLCNKADDVPQTLLQERKRSSDDCLLSRRYNLKFLRGNENDLINDDTSSPYFRSKSMVELRRRKNHDNVLRQTSDTTHDVKKTTQLYQYEDSVDNVKKLLEEYERNKLGFRINPFLQDEQQKILMGRRCMSSLDDDSLFKQYVNRDSQLHQRVWAEIIVASIHFALALTDEQLSPLLPILVSGVRILTQHVHEPMLQQCQSDLFQRIAYIYKLGTG
ncbi:brefeldin A-inhibited guanine nucleotide-exchange protein 3 isoform X2 [Copidosoma floridanum]|nr:brefeldin A-inhibited guanine nucleotide-exchange protein 3 isoform X2 [Copidosoma floridanum]